MNVKWNIQTKKLFLLYYIKHLCIIIIYVTNDCEKLTDGKAKKMEKLNDEKQYKNNFKGKSNQNNIVNCVLLK